MQSNFIKTQQGFSVFANVTLRRDGICTHRVKQA